MEKQRRALDENEMREQLYQRKKRRRRKKRRKLFFRMIYLILVFGLSAYILTILLFSIKNVEVEGNDLYSEEVLKNAVLTGDFSNNTLIMFLKYKFFAEEEIPFIESVDVTMKGMHTLHIYVNEKTIIGYMYVEELEKYAYFDEEGTVVEISDSILQGYPCVEGLQCPAVEVDDALPLDETTLEELLTLSQTLRKYELLPDMIYYDTSENPVLLYGSIKAEIGKTEYLNQKIERLKVILPELEGKKGILHLEDWSEKNTNIVFEQE